MTDPTTEPTPAAEPAAAPKTAKGAPKKGDDVFLRVRTGSDTVVTLAATVEKVHKGTDLVDCSYDFRGKRITMESVRRSTVAGETPRWTTEEPVEPEKKQRRRRS